MTTVDDSDDLARFGYRQELDRTLGGFSAFAAGFSYLSILTGIFQMFYLGFGAGGAAFIWSWPLVLGGQFLVALGFAELAAHYPLSGGAYQWSKLAGSPRLGFIVGWIYLACLIVTLAAVALALEASLPQISPVFRIVGDAESGPNAMNAVLLGCGMIVLTTILNSAGVRILAKVNNTGVVTELTGAILLVVLLWAFAVRSPQAVLLDATGRSAASLLGPLLASAALTASYVMYGFDTAGSLAEETTNPRRNAPRAILQALGAAGVLGFLLLLGALMAAPDLTAAGLGRIDGGLPSIVTAALGGTFGRLLLVNVIFAIFVCALAVQAGAVRLVFAMARDGLLPFSGALASVSPVSKTPVLPVIVIGAAAAAILAANTNLPKLVELVTMIAVLWANLAYLIVTAALLRRRVQGWPFDGAQGRPAATAGEAPEFSLGRFGIPVNVAAVLWSAFMVVNVGWPRAAVYGTEWRTRFAPIILTTILVATALVASAWRSSMTRRPRRSIALCLLFAAVAAVTARGAAQAPAPSPAPAARPATHRIIALAEPGQTLHQPFADAAMQWLRETAATEGFAVDYIRTTEPIDDAYLEAHDLFVQINYPPYRWTPVAEAAFKKAMERGTIGWVGFHHASLLGKFDGFEMSPFFHEFMGNIVFKSYIPDFATGTVHVEDTAHPLFTGLPAAFTIENDEWYTYDRSPRPDVRVLATVDEDSYQPPRTIKMGDHPVIWTNPRYKARNVYFQFGHKAELLHSATFTRLFLNAIRWAARR